MIKPDFETTYTALRKRLTGIDFLAKSTLLGAKIQDSELVTFREFKTSGPLSGYFVENAQKLIAGAFAGKISALEARCKKLKGALHSDDDAVYDLCTQFDALPMPEKKELPLIGGQT